MSFEIFLLMAFSDKLNYLRTGWQKTQGLDPFKEWNLSILKLWGIRAYAGLITCLAMAGAYLVLHGLGQAHYLNDKLILALQMTLPPLLFPLCLWHFYSYEKLARPGLFKSDSFFIDLDLVIRRQARDGEPRLNCLIGTIKESQAGVCPALVTERFIEVIRPLILQVVRAEQESSRLKEVISGSTPEDDKEEMSLTKMQWDNSARTYKLEARKLFEAGQRLGINGGETTLQGLYGWAKAKLAIQSKRGQIAPA